MDTETQDFIEAVQNNQYGELELDDGFVLVTPWSSTESFNPFLVIPDGFDSEDGLMVLLEDHTNEFMTFDDVVINHNPHLETATIENAELDLTEEEND